MLDCNKQKSEEMRDAKMVKIEEMYEHFLQMEADRRLFETLKIGNIKIWHYIRYWVYNWVAELVCGIENPNHKRLQLDVNTKLTDWLDDNIIKNQFRVKKKDVLIFNHSRRVKQGTYYNCIYTDEWLKDFERTYYVYESKYANQMHFKPVKTKNLRYVDKENYASLFHKKYDLGVSKLNIQKIADEVINLLTEEFDIHFTDKHCKLMSGVIEYHWRDRIKCHDYYKYLLKKIQPKVIAYVVGYTMDNMVIAELAKEMGIPTIELQHGRIGREHLAYNFKADVKLNTFPDYLFVAGQYELDTVRLPIPKENVYMVGVPELDKKIEYYNNALEKRKKKKKIITFISSGEHEIANAAMELYEKLDKNVYKVYLKLHPSEYTNWKNKYRALKKSGVEVVSDSKHDIYYYLAVSDYMIGIASTVLFEATRFKCKIMILKVGRYFNSESIIQTGNGIYIESMEDAVQRIQRNDIEKCESTYFYCTDSIQRIYASIDDVISRSRTICYTK